MSVRDAWSTATTAPVALFVAGPQPTASTAIEMMTIEASLTPRAQRNLRVVVDEEEPAAAQCFLGVFPAHERPAEAAAVLVGRADFELIRDFHGESALFRPQRRSRRNASLS